MDHLGDASGSGRNEDQEGLPQITLDPPSPDTELDPPGTLPGSGSGSADPNILGEPVPTTSNSLPNSRPRSASIRLRKLSSAAQLNTRPTSQLSNDEQQESSTRQRSSSNPSRPTDNASHALDLSTERTRPLQLPSLVEEKSGNLSPEQVQPLEQPATTGGRLRSLSDASKRGSIIRRSAGKTATAQTPTQEYDAQLLDYLDVLDPEVSTLNTLTNVQNSLFIPNLGKYFNRQGTYNLTRQPIDIEDTDSGTDTPPISSADDIVEGKSDQLGIPSSELTRISSTISHTPGHYAALPHDVSLDGWTEEEKAQLNDHVRHLLHSRRARMNRGMKGFMQYISHPLGFFVTFYAVAITAFGLAWVLFLIGWINVGGRRSYEINVIDNVLVALFAVMGDGLAPFRTVDTYHMIYIAHYHRLSWRLRKEKGMPDLADENDLPAKQLADGNEGVEKTVLQDEYFSVLTPEQQKKLEHHQEKFAKSHTFYKPHETETHHAFPLRLLIAIVVLLDCHSLLQISLGSCTWAISYHHRPFALTTVILCCSITVNITAGILITIGDRKTRKKDVIEKLERQALTKTAMRKVKKAKEVQKTQLQAVQEPQGAASPVISTAAKPSTSVTGASSDFESSFHTTLDVH